MINFLKNKVLPILKWFGSSFIWVFMIMLTLDIVSKILVMQNIAVGENIVLIPGFLRISHVLNTHAAFGIGPDNPVVSRILYLVVAGLASIGIIFYYIRAYKKTAAFIRGCLMLILTGALGNIVDRVFYGPEYAVIDFIDFYGIWPYVFNIADCCVVIGAFMLVGYIIIVEVKDYLARKKAEEVEFRKEKDGK